jgi:hypothetical protein
VGIHRVWRLPRLGTGMLIRRGTQVPLTVAAILVVTLSSLPLPTQRHSSAKFGLDTGGAGTAPSFYPYLVNASLFPQPDALVGPQISACGGLLLGTVGRDLYYPRTTSVVIGGVPTILLLATAATDHCVWAGGYWQAQFYTDLVLYEGTYSPSQAVGLLNGSAAPTHLPLQWSAPQVVASAKGWSSFPNASSMSGDALAASGDGKEIYAAYVSGSTTYLWSSISSGPWTNLTSGGIQGTDPQLSFGGAAVALVSRSVSSLTVATFYLSGVQPALTTLSVSAYHDSVTWYPTQAMGEEAILATTSGNAVIFYGSYDGGHVFSSHTIANISTASANNTIFGTIASTRIANPIGYPGEIAATTEGSTLFGLYTAEVNNQTAVATMTSPDGGVHWNAPQFLQLSFASVLNPSLSSSSVGYVYSTWLENAGGGWTVDAAEFGQDGRLLTGPNPLPGATPGGVSANALTGVTVDAFARPFYAWTLPVASVPSAVSGCSANELSVIVPSNGCSVGVIQYSGAYLSPANALGVLQRHMGSLGAWDYKLGTLGTLNTLVSSKVAIIDSSVANYTAHKHPTDLCQAQNSTANGVYANLTHILFSYQSGPTACGNFAYAIAETTSPIVNGVPQPPPNYYWTQPIAINLGAAAANVYLGVLSDWALESIGVPVTFTGDPLRGFNPVNSVLPSLATPITTTISVQGRNAWVSVLPAATEPTTGILTISGSFPVQVVNWTGAEVWCTRTHRWDNWSYSATAMQTSLRYNVSVENNTAQYSGSGSGFPSVYLTNLTPNATMRWNGTFTGVYPSSFVHSVVCGASNNSNPIAPPQYGLKAKVVISVSGSITTSLRMVPWPPSLVISGAQSNALRYYWNQTMPAMASASITDLTHGYGPTWMNSSNWLVAEALGTFTVSLGTSYRAYMTSLSQSGIWDNTQVPGISAKEVYSSPPLSTGYVCSFTLANNPVSVSALAFSNISGGNATVTWASSASGTGWITYYGMATGSNLTQTATVSGSGPTYYYHVQLHGLDPQHLFAATVTTAVGAGCLTYENSLFGTFTTVGAFPVRETDLPYDSVANQGGGAVLSWQLPTNITQYGLANGSLLLVNNSANPTTVSYPLNNLSEITNRSLGSLFYGSYSVTIQPSSLNTSYSLALFFNFTAAVNGHQIFWLVTSARSSFIYQRDSSGDGLTDAEKLRGWWVPVTAGLGGVSPIPGQTWVWANPGRYSSNGLVSDFVEKEFTLDPNTIDTASSHMLDTWNLTFDLGTGPNPPSCPTGFQCWYTNTTNPFAQAPYPGGTPAVVAKSTNTTGPRTPVDDSSAYDASILWTGGTLSYLQGLVQNQSLGWLRGAIGKYPATGHWTLTVWGKLSWGANPLVASTPANGQADGARVNPLGTEDVQVAVYNWTANVSQGDGVAAFFNANSSLAPGSHGNQTDYSGYSRNVQAGVGGHSYYGGTFTVTFPVISSEQYARLNVSVVKHHSGFSNSVNLGPLAIDLANTSVHLKQKTSGQGSIYIRYQVIPVYSRAPTYIYVPADNSTLSPLPTGLQRYTAEQNFILLVANDTTNGTDSLAQGSIPYVFANGTASSGRYSVSLSGGSNNILVPRSIFIGTPLGEALFNGTNVSETQTSGTNGNGFLQSHWDPQTWYARVVGKTSWNGSNYAPGKTGFIRVFSNVSQNCTTAPSLCGGVPSNPQIESGQQALALEALLTLNVTNLGQLDGFLAGLLLNRSGNFSGSLLRVTSFLPSLGLPAGVMRALANSSFENDGGFGAPTSSQSQPQSWSGLPASTIWNSVTGVAGFVSVCWNGALAGIAYASKLVQLVVAWGLGAINQVATVLKQVAEGITWAFQQLVEATVDLIETLLATAFSPYFSARSHDAHLQANVLTNATTNFSPGGNISANNASAILDSTSNSMFIFSTVAAVSIEVAIGILTAVTAGAALTVSQLVILFLTTAAAAIAMPYIIGPLGVAWTYTIEGKINQTAPQGSNQPWWRAMADAFGWYDTGLGATLATQSLRETLKAPLTSAAVGDLIAFAFGGVAAGLGVVSSITNDRAMAITALGLATVSLVLEARIVLLPSEANPIKKDLNIITGVLDAAAWASGAATLYYCETHQC